MGSLIAPAPLGDQHDLDGFACGEASLDDWPRRRARANAASGASKTFVVCDGAQVVAYYSLAVGAVDHKSSTGKMRRNLPDPIPIMIIGRLAVDQRAQSKGIARGLVKDAIVRTLKVAEQAGVRGILVHAVSDEAACFWLALGFSPSPLEARVLMISLADAAEALAEP